MLILKVLLPICSAELLCLANQLPRKQLYLDKLVLSPLSIFLSCTLLTQLFKKDTQIYQISGAAERNMMTPSVSIPLHLTFLHILCCTYKSKNGGCPCICTDLRKHDSMGVHGSSQELQ